MSKNRNRAKLNKAKDGRTYCLIYLNELYPPYWDDGIRTHHRRTVNTMVGSKNYRCWKRNELMHYQYRMYRTWKHNRETKWKQ